jgi:hypothetical protein
MQVFIMRGVSGSGKSTVAGQIAAHFGPALCRTVSADGYFCLPYAEGADRDYGLPPEGEYNFNPGELGFAHAYCMRNFLKYLENGLNVIVDNTNTTWGEIAPYVLVAAAYRADVVIINVHCDEMTSHGRNVHGVPLEVVRAMTARMREPLPPFAPAAVHLDGDGLPIEVYGCLSEIPADGGMAIQRNAGSVGVAVYDRHPYEGYQDEDGYHIYTRQAIVIR